MHTQPNVRSVTRVICCVLHVKNRHCPNLNRTDREAWKLSQGQDMATLLNQSFSMLTYPSPYRNWSNWLCMYFPVAGVILSPPETYRPSGVNLPPATGVILSTRALSCRTQTGVSVSVTSGITEPRKTCEFPSAWQHTMARRSIARQETTSLAVGHYDVPLVKKWRKRFPTPTDAATNASAETPAARTNAEADALPVLMVPITVFRGLRLEELWTVLRHVQDAAT